MIVGKAIYYLLTNATGVTDIVSTRVYPEVAQQDAALPYIVYNVTNNEPTDTKPEPSKLDTAQVEVNIYSGSYTEAIDLAVAVRAALDRVKGTYNGVNVQSIQYLNEIIDFDEPQRAYNINADYDVRISRTDFEIAQGSPITGVELGELSDVNVAGATDNQVLSYDAATDTWIPANDGGAIALDDLSDVDAAQPTGGQLLSYGQGGWVTIDQDEVTLPIGSVTGLQAALDATPDALDDLTDVKIVGTPTDGDALVYSSGFWARGTAGASTLGDLSDVNLTTPSTGAYLQYDGANWIDSVITLPSVPSTYYHNRYATEAETLRAGATATVELYYTAQADGDGYAQSAESDTATAGFDIRRKLYYSEAAQADPDTGTWVQFATIPDDTTFASAKATLLAYLKERTGGTVPISLKMTWEEVAEAPSFTGLLNESYGSGAAAAYSVRRLNGLYTGAAIQVERSSDNTTQDIGFDSNGNLDESALTTFCTGTVCKVRTWYDQSVTGGTGSGNDAVQTVHANQPTIYTGGAIVKENGRVAFEFDGTNDGMDFASNIRESAGASTVLSVHKQVSETTLGNYLLLYKINRWLHSTDVNYSTLSMSTNNVANKYVRFQTYDTGNQNLHSVFFDGSTQVNNVDDQNLYIDGTEETSSTSLVSFAATSTGANSIGYRSDTNSQFANVQAQELIIYTSDKSTDRTSIESNIGDYFTQNTPLLDTYTGAAAAYSLRKLRTAYTGSAIRVRRASDNTEQDIGFNVFGELDTVSLASFCSGTDGFVKVWYDQSGSANDATQTTTAYQPKIYDSVTGVVTENGKPALEFDGSNDGYLLDTTGLDIGSLSSFTVGRMITISNAVMLALSGSTSDKRWYAPFITGGNFNYGYANSSTAITTTQDTNQNLHTMIAGTTLGGVEAWKNGTSAGTTTRTTGIDSGMNGIANFNSSFYANCNVQEVVYYGSDESANRTNIESNINTFYSIY